MGSVPAVATVPRHGRLAPATAWRPLVVPQWSDTTGPAQDGPDDGSPGHAARAVRGRRTRHMLLLGAAHCFAARGYSGASLSDILAETGRERGRALTKGAFYVHFESKHDLARCLVDEACASWSAVVDSYSAAPTTENGLADPLWDVLAIADSMVGMAMYDPVARASWRLRFDDEAYAGALARTATRDTVRMAGMLSRARELGLLRNSVDPVGVLDHLNTLYAGHLARTEGASPTVTPDLWDRMSSTWRQVLPGIGTERWLTVWRASGWAWRPRPDPEAFDRARRLAVA